MTTMICKSDGECQIMNIIQSFLFLKDGATLPEGPVFISPDGLLPSLYREGDILMDIY